VTYYRQGRVEQAAAMMRQNLELRQDLLGPDHPAVATAHNNLGDMLRALGDPAAAEAQFRTALKIRQTTLGPDHARTLTTRHNLATLFAERGDRSRAEKIWRDVLDRLRNTLGSEHPRVARVLQGMGTMYASAGDYAAAGAAYREALSIREQATPEHEATVSLHLLLGDVLRAQGRFEEAEPYIVDGVALARSAAPDVRKESRAMFKRFYDAWGRPDRAIAVRDSLGLDSLDRPGPDGPEPDGDASIAAGPTDPES